MRTSLPDAAFARISFFALAILLLADFSFSQSVFIPNHESLLAHNSALAQSLSHSPNVPPNGTNATTPSISNPFSFAYVRILSSMPSVGSLVSSRHAPQIFWTWGESHSTYLSRLVDGCNSGFESLSAAGEPYFEGELTASAGRNSITLPAHSQIIQIPPSIMQNLSISRGENSTPIFPKLNVTLSGKVKMKFTHYLKAYSMKSEAVGVAGKGMTGRGEYCGADERIETITKESAQLSSSRTYEVEVGEPYFLLISPISREQLTFSPKAEAVALSSRKPATLSLILNDAELNSTARASFETIAGEFGEWNLISKEENIFGTGFAGELSSSNLSAPLDFSKSAKYLDSTALSPSSQASAYQFLLSTHAQLPDGASTFGVSMRDYFNDNYSTEWKTLTRDISIIEVENNSAKGFAANGTLAVRQIPLESENSSAGANFKISGNNSLRERDALVPAPSPISQFFLAAIPLFAFAALLWLYFRFREN